MTNHKIWMKLFALVCEEKRTLDEGIAQLMAEGIDPEQIAEVREEWEYDTKRIATTDWEHGDDFVAQEYRELIGVSR